MINITGWIKRGNRTGTSVLSGVSYSCRQKFISYSVWFNLIHVSKSRDNSQ